MEVKELFAKIAAPIIIAPCLLIRLPIFKNKNNKILIQKITLTL